MQQGGEIGLLKCMATEDRDLASGWDPWRFIVTEYNLGVALTRGQVERVDKIRRRLSVEAGLIKKET